MLLMLNKSKLLPMVLSLHLAGVSYKTNTKENSLP